MQVQTISNFSVFENPGIHEKTQTVNLTLFILDSSISSKLFFLELQ
jgi:hypothetical protein